MSRSSKVAMMAVIVFISFGSVIANAKSIPLDKIIAIVDNDIVMQSELETRTQSVSNRLRMQGTPLPPRSVMKKRVLDQLILESIQLQKADLAGIRISDAQLNETINSIASSNKMTLDEFEAQLRREGETYASAREQIRREMIITRIQQREVDRRVRVTDQEIENFLASKASRPQSSEEYKIAHILIALPESANDEQVMETKMKAEGILAELKAGADFQQMAVAKSDGVQALEGGVIGWRKEKELPSIAADIVPALAIGEPSELIETGSGFHIISVLEKRGGKKQIIEQRLVRHILVSPSEIRSEQEAESSIRQLHERIINGDDFAQIARSHSGDPVSAIDGGELGWVSPGQMVPEFESQMLAAKVGEVVKPFRSKFGWHILEVMDTRMQDIGALLEANQAKRVIHRRKYNEELSNWLLEIKGEAYIEIKGKTPAKASLASTESSADDDDSELDE